VFEHGPTGAADVLAVLLQAGRDLEFVGQNILAKPMRVAAAGSFLGGAVRHALRPGGAGTSEENDEKAETANHDVFLHESGAKNAPWPSTFCGMRPYWDSIKVSGLQFTERR
jgi:hypothetical protein